MGAMQRRKHAKKIENDTGWHNAAARPILKALRPLQLPGVPCIRAVTNAVCPVVSSREEESKGNSKREEDAGGPFSDTGVWGGGGAL